MTVRSMTVCSMTGHSIGQGPGKVAECKVCACSIMGGYCTKNAALDKVVL